MHYCSRFIFWGKLGHSLRSKSRSLLAGQMMEKLEGECGSRSREREREKRASRVELPVEFSVQDGLFCCRTVRFSTAGVRRQPKLPDPLKRSSDELSSFFRRTERRFTSQTKEEVMRSLNHVADKSQSRFLLLYCFGTSDAFWWIVSFSGFVLWNDWKTENALQWCTRTDSLKAMITSQHHCRFIWAAGQTLDALQRPHARRVSFLTLVLQTRSTHKRFQKTQILHHASLTTAWYFSRPPARWRGTNHRESRVWLGYRHNNKRCSVRN